MASEILTAFACIQCSKQHDFATAGLIDLVVIC